MRSMLGAVGAVVFGTMIANQALADIWRWQGDIDESTVVDIEIVRGHVRIERAPRTGVAIETVVSDPKISMRITHAAGRLQVRDFYRVRPVWFPMHECLPPPGEHGDFADGSAALELVVHVPSDVVVNVRILAQY